MTKLLQSLRDELVRRDYAASTIRSYIRSLRRFASTRVRVSIGSARPNSDTTICFSSKSDGSLLGQWSPRSARSGSSVGMSCSDVTCARTYRIRSSDFACPSC